MRRDPRLSRSESVRNGTPRLDSRLNRNPPSCPGIRNARERGADAGQDSNSTLTARQRFELRDEITIRASKSRMILDLAIANASQGFKLSQKIIVGPSKRFMFCDLLVAHPSKLVISRNQIAVGLGKRRVFCDLLIAESNQRLVPRV